MQIINASYAELSDATKRAVHDKWIAKNESATTATPSPKPAPPKPAPTPSAPTPAKKSESSQLENLRALHRSDLHNLRQSHAIELENMTRRVRFDKMMGLIFGLVLSVPIYLIFSDIDYAVNKVVAAQQAKTEASMRRN
jgi:hypothetical protein